MYQFYQNIFTTLKTIEDLWFKLLLFDHKIFLYLKICNMIIPQIKGSSRHK